MLDGKMKLEIFDFDGTLVFTPLDSEENIKLYEDTTGLPWKITKRMAYDLTIEHGRPIGPRRGWWGRPETLQPPLVPDPCPESLLNKPVFERWKESKENPDVLTILMTGRHQGLRDCVFRILDQLNILDVQYTPEAPKGKQYREADSKAVVYLMGQDGPKGGNSRKPHETFPWKMWVIEQFLDLHKSKEVEMWEDRDSHVKMFSEQSGLKGATFTVNKV